MKRSILIILIFCMAVPFSDAQLWKLKRWETSAGIGPSMFFADVGGYSRTDNLLGFKDINFNQMRYNINGSVKFRVTREINVRISLTTAKLHASDSRGSNENRGYESSTSIFEPALIGEYYFSKSSAEDSYLFLKGKKVYSDGFLGSFDFYAFTGIGGLNYKVKVNDALAERGMNTGGFTAVIPVGLGANMIFSPRINFGIELGGRYAMTDYLDGYSSQFSKANDVYYFLNFAVTYKLKTGLNGMPLFR